MLQAAASNLSRIHVYLPAQRKRDSQSNTACDRENGGRQASEAILTDSLYLCYDLWNFSITLLNLSRLFFCSKASKCLKCYFQNYCLFVCAVCDGIRIRDAFSNDLVPPMIIICAGAFILFRFAQFN